MKDVLSNIIQYSFDKRNKKMQSPDRLYDTEVVHLLPKIVVARYADKIVPGIPKNVCARIVPYNCTLLSILVPVLCNNMGINEIKAE